MPVAVASRPARRLQVAALTTLLLLGAVPAPSSAQSQGGALGVSLTILSPAHTMPVSVTHVGVARGVVSLDTSSPVAGPTSQLVMVAADVDAGAATVALRGEHGDIPLPAGRALPAVATAAADAMLRYRVRPLAPNAGGTVNVTLRYLVVSGT